MPETATRRLTIDAFFDWCPKNDDRQWELFEGRPVAMTPPPSAHQIVVGNVAGHAFQALANKPGCTVRIEAGIVPEGSDDSYYQADLAVTCRPHEAGDPRNVQDPILIVEVLSPSTQVIDRRRKLPDYRCIPSVQEIVLLDPERLYCEVHRRFDADRWLVDLLRTAEDVLRLDSIGLALSLGLIYANVALVDDGEASQAS